MQIEMLMLQSTPLRLARDPQASRRLATIARFASRGCLVLTLFSWLALSETTHAQAVPTDDCVSIDRRVPPVGLDVPSQQKTAWRERIAALRDGLQASHSNWNADIGVLLKACEFAIENRELYREQDFSKVQRLLELAQQRINELPTAQPEWTLASGRQVRGFRSGVDGSVQPVGLQLPEGWDERESLPLYVWLHGRGDKNTDLHFICDRLDKDAPISPEGAILLHPFGRQCIGFKSAGETDVMEAIDFAIDNYPVDPDRIVLMGFSMGGAGVWHLAAHYGQRFVAASPGAGFAETRRYQNIQADELPPEYEQRLWSLYDVPGYTRNLFNLPVVAYSGEEDKQIQAARVMEEAYQREGRELTHLIGPGMGHKYHPDTLEAIMQRMERAVEHGLDRSPREFFIQTRHWRYGERGWLSIDGLQQAYADTRADVERSDQGWSIETRNVSRLVIDSTSESAPRRRLVVDDQPINLEPPNDDSKLKVYLERGSQAAWRQVERFNPLRKQPRLSGPIDDAFIAPFMVVLPSGSATHPEVAKWWRCEWSNFQTRWKELFRGELRIKQDHEVTDEDMRRYHLVLWGEPSSNHMLKRVLSSGEAVPIGWDQDQVTIGREQVSAESHAPVAIFPNPLLEPVDATPAKYIVINSGPTFRQAHDRTNSLQNPHLPDWALIGLDQPPSDEQPGRVVKAGFFDDRWEFDPAATW